jgi:hypothetical protein
MSQRGDPANLGGGRIAGPAEAEPASVRETVYLILICCWLE